MAKATLSDACGIAHLALLDGVVVVSVEEHHDIVLVVMADGSHAYTTHPATHVYQFENGKTTFTDSDGIQRAIELFAMVPLTDEAFSPQKE